MQRAIYGTAEGEILVGHGPFCSFSEPPSSGVAFYMNDFALSEAAPWKVPDRVEVLRKQDPATELEIFWQDPEPEAFAGVFREVSEAIAHGTIEKSVPVVVEQGILKSGDPSSILTSLAALPKTLRPYGFFDDDSGFLGATPEVLFSLAQGQLHTMALAGTARQEESVVFAVDEKEIREHEFVAQTLIAKLSDLGMVRRREREILDLGKLVHFQTLIDVELYRSETIDSLIQRLHPTPALGPLPRTSETLANLYEWRQRLGCPGYFGAPFGLWRDGSFEALVAIRLVAWEGGNFQLPSGCGVIEESRLVNEWRELRLKRDAVRELLNL